jgi:Amt family ammonium transporter
VPVWSAIIIGASAGPVCYLGITLVKKRLKIDDALDAFGCHGIGGIWGGLLTGLFAAPGVGGATGLFYGNPKQFGAQIVAILASILLAAVGSLVCIGIVKAVTTIRVPKRDELVGLDVTQHGENAYPSFNGLD